MRSILIYLAITAITTAAFCYAALIVTFPLASKTHDLGAVKLTEGSLYVSWSGGLSHYGTGPRLDWRGWSRPNLLPHWSFNLWVNRISIPIWMAMFPVLAGAWAVKRWRRRVKPGHCGRCGYDLRTITSTTCPECGSSHLDAGPESSKVRVGSG